MGRPKKEEEPKSGKMSIKSLRDIIDKKAGYKISYDLTQENPTEVKTWISTGSRWLDSIIAKGQLAGIPVGKITELAGIEASGKSYLAAQIIKNAQALGIDAVLFDSESAYDPEFLTKIGVDVDRLLYVQAESVEFVLETIETLLANNQNRMLFVWDSFGNTQSKADIEDEEFNPQSSMARIPRIMTLGMKKLTIPLANSQSSLLIVNQLKTKIGDPMMMKFDPWFTPGGKALDYAYSLRIWLTARKAKDSYLTNAAGFRVGTELKAKLKKSRFGSEGRECSFKITWGEDPVGIRDEESWLEAISSSSRFEGGSWKTLKLNDGTIAKFQEASWLEKLKEPKFREAVLTIMEEEVIQKFAKKEGSAKAFYDLDKEETSQGDE